MNLFFPCSCSQDTCLKSVQPLERTLWRLLKNQTLELPCDSAISLPNKYLEKTKTLTQKDTCTSVFTAALFIYLFISWRLTTLQYCSGFCHTLKRISHGFTCVPHPDPPSHVPLHPIPLGLPSAPGPSVCLMYPTWAGDLFHPR